VKIKFSTGIINEMLEEDPALTTYAYRYGIL